MLAAWLIAGFASGGENSCSRRGPRDGVFLGGPDNKLSGPPIMQHARPDDEALKTTQIRYISDLNATSSESSAPGAFLRHGLLLFLCRAGAFAAASGAAAAARPR